MAARGGGDKPRPYGSFRPGRRLKQGGSPALPGSPLFIQTRSRRTVLALLVILGFPHEGAHHVALRQKPNSSSALPSSS